MTSTGMRPSPDPHDPHDIKPSSDIEPRSDVEAVPDEEGLDPGTVEDDLSESPEEKRNATDGYAPADDPTWDDEQLED